MRSSKLFSGANEPTVVDEGSDTALYNSLTAISDLFVQRGTLLAFQEDLLGNDRGFQWFPPQYENRAIPVGW